MNSCRWGEIKWLIYMNSLHTIICEDKEPGNVLVEEDTEARSIEWKSYEDAGYMRPRPLPL